MNQELQGSDDSAIRRFSIFTLSGQACCTMSSQTSNSWHWKGWDSYSLIVLPSLESKPILLTLDLWEGGGQQGGAFTDDKETLTKHGRRTLMPCHRVLSGTRALTAPAVLWSVSSQRAPRAAGTSQVLLSCESCPCQDTLCYAFFKKYLVYFFKLRLKYKSQSMGTEF